MGETQPLSEGFQLLNFNDHSSANLLKLLITLFLERGKGSQASFSQTLVEVEP